MHSSGQPAPRPPPSHRQSGHCHPSSRNSCRAASRHIPGFGLRPMQTLASLALAASGARTNRGEEGRHGGRECGDPQFGSMRSKASLDTHCPPPKGTLGSQSQPGTEACPELVASRSSCMHRVGGRALHHSRYFLTRLPQLPTHRHPTGRLISINLGEAPGSGGGGGRQR